MVGPLAYPPIYNFASDEIVDDSEPERAELRKKGKQARSLRVCSTKMDSEVEILSVAPTGLKTCIPHDRSVIEISDSETEMIIPLRLKCTTTKSPNRVCQRPVVNAEASTSQRQLSPLHNGSATIVPKTFNLSQFAFANPAVRKKAAAPARGIATAALPSLNPTVQRPIPRPSKLMDIPLSDLAKISRCVSCEVSWTARKTAIQKMAHIKSCAKKNNFTDETIQLLIQKEAANHVPAVKQSKRKEKDSISKESSSKDTYMDGILVGAAPRKKGKHQQAQTVLAKVSTTRDSILERAQTILATTTHDINFATYSTPKHTATHLETHDETLLLPTHAFGQSALALRQGATSQTLFSTIYSPPITPAIEISSDTPLTLSPPIHIIPSSPDIVSRATPGKEHQYDPIQSAGGPYDAQISDSSALYHISLAIGEDNFENHDFSETVSTVSLSTPPRKSAKKPRTPKTKSPLIHTIPVINEIGAAEEVSVPSKRSRTRKMPVKKAKVVYTFDDKWETHMMEHIHQDPNLHLRVLRYEPIDFNVFLEIAQRYGAPYNGRLKLHLRTYLDKKAIHFYEASRV